MRVCRLMDQSGSVFCLFFVFFFFLIEREIMMNLNSNLHGA